MKFLSDEWIARQADGSVEPTPGAFGGTVLTVVTGGPDGEVRFLYLMTNFLGTVVAECVDFPFPMCFWTPQSDSSVSELRIGWPAQPKQWATVAEDVFPTGLTAVVDAGGRIHMSFYDSENTGDPVVRYLRVE